MTVIFETERLRVRRWTEADAEAAFRIYGDPEVTRFLAGPDSSVEHTRARLRRIVARYDEFPGFGCWAITSRDTGEAYGSVILKVLPETAEIEVGWHLARSAWGHGYAMEAARACLDYGFHVLGLHRIVAVVRPDNPRSIAVTRRLGMTHEGQIHAYGRDLELFVAAR